MLSKPTSDHATIFFWADSHNAVPAEVLPNENSKTAEPVLSFVFDRDDMRRESVRPISWEQFFAVFDIFELSFAYEEQPGSSRRFLFQRRYAW